MLEANLKKNNSNELEWKKEGDYSKLLPFHHSSVFNRHIRYIASEANESKLRIQARKGSDEVRISYESLDGQLSEILNSKFDGLGNISTECWIETNDKKIMRRFLNEIGCHISILKIKKEIFSLLDLSAIWDEEEFYSELIGLVEKEKTEEAIEKAKSVEDIHEDVLLRFGNRCEDHGKFSEAIEIYQEISTNNPNYKEAAKRIVYVIIQYLDFHDKLTEDEKQNLDSHDKLTADKKQTLIELKFKYMLDSEDEQDVIDYHFNDLCGGGIERPTISRVSCNPDTLIALANQTSMIRMENRNLQEKNSSLIQELTLLREQLNELKNSGVNAPTVTFF